MKSKFKLDPSIQTTPPGSVFPVLSSLNQEFNFQLDNTSNGTTSEHESRYQHGDYTSNITLGRFPLQWTSAEELGIWLKKEQEQSMIELRLRTTCVNQNATKVYYYFCSREGTGGVRAYSKKHPERERKIHTKRLRCPCRLVVKSYPNTNVLLGQYHADHSHPIGDENARFTSLSQETRIRIAEMLRLKMSHSQIVRCHLITGYLANSFDSYTRFKGGYMMIHFY